MKKTVFIGLLSALLTCVSSFAQVVVTPAQGMSVATLVNDYFISDESVELDTYPTRAPKFNGQTVINSNAIGTFTNATTGGTNMPLSSGIVMVTGDCTDAGQNAPGSHGSTQVNPPADGGTTYSPALYQVYTSMGGNKSMNDIACLSFWIIPKSENLSFSYCFASEEYPTYVCSDYNDTFGFFISGPYDENNNIVTSYGTYYQNENIALIPPDYELPVMINKVNSGSVGSSGSTSNPTCDLSHSAYFRTNTDNTNCMMNGYTVELETKKIEVVPCYRYRIELAICDISDKALNSAVYLKANSLHADAYNFSVDNSNASFFTDDNLPVYTKGCSNLKVSVSPNFDPNSSRQYSVQIESSDLGTLTEGDDYEIVNDDGEPVGSTINIPRHGTEGHFWINFLHNDAKAPLATDTLFLISEYINDCTPRDTIRILLQEPDEMTVEVFGGKVYCDNELPLREEIKIVSHGAHNFTRAIITNEQNEVLFDTTAHYVGDADSMLIVYRPIIQEPVVFNINVEDFCGRTFSHSVQYLINGATTQASISRNYICEGEKVTLSCPQTETYLWSAEPTDESLFGQESLREPEVSPKKNTEYTVTITDENGCIATSSVDITVVSLVKAKMSLSSHRLTTSSSTLNYEDLTINAVDRRWNFNYNDNGIIENADDTTHYISGAKSYPAGDTLTPYVIQLIAYNAAYCPDTAYDTIYVVPDFTFYLPNAFTPGDPDLDLAIFQPKGSMLEYFTIDIYNRWGTKIFSGKPNQGWDGRYKGNEFVPQGTYVFDIYYRDGDGLLQRVNGTIAVLPKVSLK
ncbi:MAG: choice-of-anchor L domain-containing protein [Bacteroidales bacterium]|nr:choice-of-anchor L domain-containing protein [Bacteroidales bacterium]